jgi:hypothetical protein
MDFLLIACVPFIVFYVLYESSNTHYPLPVIIHPQNVEQDKLKKIQENLRVVQNNMIESLLILYQRKF